MFICLQNCRIGGRNRHLCTHWDVFFRSKMKIQLRNKSINANHHFIIFDDIALLRSVRKWILIVKKTNVVHIMNLQRYRNDNSGTAVTNLLFDEFLHRTKINIYDFLQTMVLSNVCICRFEHRRKQEEYFIMQGQTERYITTVFYIKKRQL